jgi:hypothetical protein
MASGANAAPALASRARCAAAEACRAAAACRTAAGIRPAKAAAMPAQYRAGVFQQTLLASAPWRAGAVTRASAPCGRHRLGAKTANDYENKSLNRLFLQELLATRRQGVSSSCGVQAKDDPTERYPRRTLGLAATTTSLDHDRLRCRND